MINFRDLGSKLRENRRAIGLQGRPVFGGSLANGGGWRVPQPASETSPFAPGPQSSPIMTDTGENLWGNSGSVASTRAEGLHLQQLRNNEARARSGSTSPDPYYQNQMTSMARLLASLRTKKTTPIMID